MPIRPGAAAFAASLTAALAACAALAGCSLGGDEEPKPVAGAPKEIARVVAELERASRARDWATVCEDLFSTGALERAGGGDCVELLGETAGQVRRPDIRLVSMRVTEDRAEVRVRTRASGQAPVEDTLVLIREGGEWRIEALTAG